MIVWKFIGRNVSIAALRPVQFAITTTVTWVCYSVGLTVLSIVLNFLDQNPQSAVSLVLCFIVPLPDSISLGIKTWRVCSVLLILLRDWQIRNAVD